MRYFGLMIALAALGGGCQKQAKPEPPSLMAGGGEPAPPTDHPPLAPAAAPIYAAGVQRLTVQQLRRSYPIAMGRDTTGRDVTWRLPSGATGLDAMAAAMGEPNYITTTEEAIEPSPLYAKFADDAARSVCDQALRADAIKESERVVMRFVRKTDTLQSNPKGVRDNLRYLKLRLHGVKLAGNDDLSVAALASLFDQVTQATAAGKAVTAEHVAEGWRAVCVAMMNAPEFHAY